MKTKGLKIYNVAAQVFAGDPGNQATIWEGTFDDIIASNKTEAEEITRARIEAEVTEYDPRVHPGIRICSITVEEINPLSLAQRLVAKAEAHGQDTGESDHTIGDLQDALQVCFEFMTSSQIAGALAEMQQRAGGQTAK
jgi:hypothetical protein